MAKWTSTKEKYAPDNMPDKNKSEKCIILTHSDMPDSTQFVRAFHFCDYWRDTETGRIMSDVDYWILESDLIAEAVSQ